MIAEVQAVLEGRATWALVEGDCLDSLRSIPDASIDAIVTDPPAGIAFMSKGWDSDKGGRENWISWLSSVMAECLRVLKPGGHALVWAIPRTSHWTATALEDAGFEIRDRVSHLQGAGFPKSLEVQYPIMIESGVCLSNAPAPHVVALSRFLPVESPGVKEPIAVALARIPQEDEPGLLIRIGGAGASPAAMAMSPATWRGEATCSNIASSTSAILAAFSDPTRTCITATEIVETIGSTTWSFALTQATRKIITHRKETRPDGCRCPASVVVESLNVPAAQCKRTPTCFARASATSGADSPGPLVDDLHTVGNAPEREPSLRSLVASFSGLGTSLKPAVEDWWLCRKPLAGTVAANVLTHGTGALNIDKCRVPGVKPEMGPRTDTVVAARAMSGVSSGHKTTGRMVTEGRWPANFVLSHTPECQCVGTKRVAGNGHWPAARGQGGLGTAGHAGQDDLDERHAVGEVEAWECSPDCPVRLLDEQSGEAGAAAPASGTTLRDGNTSVARGRFAGLPADRSPAFHGDTGGASRFFATFAPDTPRFLYTAKASRSERDQGLAHLKPASGGEATGRKDGSAGLKSPRAGAGRTATLDSTEIVCYAPSSWVNEVLSRTLPEDTVASLRKATIGSTIRASDGSVWSMCWCGSPSTDPSLPGISSIIETATSSTTDRTTWNSSPQPHTNGCIAAACGAMVSGGSPASCAARASPSGKSTGISAPRDGPSTDDADHVTSVESWLTAKPERGGGRRVGIHNVHPT